MNPYRRRSKARIASESRAHPAIAGPGNPASTRVRSPEGSVARVAGGPSYPGRRSCGSRCVSAAPVRFQSSSVVFKMRGHTGCTECDRYPASRCAARAWGTPRGQDQHQVCVEIDCPTRRLRVAPEARNGAIPQGFCTAGVQNAASRRRATQPRCNRAALLLAGRQRWPLDPSENGPVLAGPFPSQTNTPARFRGLWHT